MTESRIQNTMEYMEENPTAKIATVARDFGVPHGRLLQRLNGIPAKKGRPGTSFRLTEAEEMAICRYIDRLDNINLSVRPEFIEDVANVILKARAPKAEQTIPLVIGPN